MHRIRKFVPKFKVTKPNNFCMIAEANNAIFTITIGLGLPVSDLEYIEYSLDLGDNWIKTYNIDNEEVIINTPTINNGKCILLRGKGIKLHTGYSESINLTSCVIISCNVKYKVRGCIMSLLKADEIVDENTPLIAGSNLFTGLFYNSSTLTSAKDLILPKLVNGVTYSHMFYQCSSLLYPPELPAKSITTKSYNYMFYGCSSLRYAPELPATTLGYQSYGYMFLGCTSLTIPPELPAQKITLACYSSMFRECISLTTAPELSTNTTAPVACYSSMFYGCTSLVLPPELPATTLSNSSYSSMFYNCSSLIAAPELPALNVPYGCYSSMFYGCTSLKVAPELPATTIGEMAYYQMFRECTSLETPPSIIPVTIISRSSCWRMFINTKIQTTPILPATSIEYFGYNAMFSGCTSLLTASDLPATTLGENCYQSMFSGCTSLTVAPVISARTLALNCYLGMFNGCTSLTASPDLPAPVLVYGSYYTMLYGCSNMVYIKMLAIDISAENCLYMWVHRGSATGTFVKHPDMEDLPRGSFGIPNGWNVINMTPWADYPVYEYVLNGAALKIDTGICADDNTRLEVKFTTNNTSSFYSIGTRTGSSGSHLFSITGSVNDLSIIFGVGTTSLRTTFTRTSTWTTYKAWMQTNGDMTFSCYMTDGTDTYSLDNITYASSLENNDLPIYLFSNGFNNINANTLRIHYVKIYKSGLLIGEFRPCDVNGLNYIVNLVTLDNLSNQNLVYV